MDENLTRIERMIQAGFTADEIRTLFGSLANTEGGEDNNPSNDPAGDQGGAPDNPPESSPDQASELAAEVLKMVKDLKGEVNKQIDELKKSYQEYNFKFLQNNGVPKELTGVEACAQILNPPSLTKRKE